MEAVNQVLRESSEHYEVIMMQEIQGFENRYEGPMEENESKVAQVFGFRSTRSSTRSKKP